MAEDVEVQETALDDGSLGAATEKFKAFLNGGNDPPQEQASQGTDAPQAPVAAQAEAPAQSAPVAETAAPVQQAPAAQAPAPVQGQQPQAPAAPTNTSELDKTLTFAKVLTTQLQQQLMGEFSDITSEADVYKLMENPERYNRFAIAVAKVQAANTQVGQLEQQRIKASEEANKAAEGERMKARAETSKKIGELIPDLLKPDVAPKLSADMTAYARANEVPPVRYVDATAGEVNILYKAMQYDAAKASEAAAIKAASEKASKAPLVQQPGTRVPGDGKTEKMQESFTTLQKTGRVDAAADVFRHILG